MKISDCITVFEARRGTFAAERLAADPELMTGYYRALEIELFLGWGNIDLVNGSANEAIKLKLRPGSATYARSKRALFAAEYFCRQVAEHLRQN